MKKIITPLIVLVVFTAIIAGFYIYNAQHTCGYGVSGTNAKVIVQGMDSQAFCDNTVNNNSPKLYVYDASQPTGEPEICSFTVSKWTVRVYDEGIFDFIGRSECAYFAYASMCGIEAANSNATNGTYPNTCNAPTSEPVTNQNTPDTPIPTPTDTPIPTDTPTPTPIPLFTFHGYGNGTSSFTANHNWIPQWTCTSNDSNATIIIAIDNNGSSNSYPCDGTRDTEWFSAINAGSYHIQITTQGKWAVYIIAVDYGVSS